MNLYDAIKETGMAIPQAGSFHLYVKEHTDSYLHWFNRKTNIVGSIVNYFWMNAQSWVSYEKEKIIDKFNNETPEKLLIRRMFKVIAYNHFNDHKMAMNYINEIFFDRSLGDDISDYIEKHYPKYYKKYKKELT